MNLFGDQRTGENVETDAERQIDDSLRKMAEFCSRER